MSSEQIAQLKKINAIAQKNCKKDVSGLSMAVRMGAVSVAVVAVALTTFATLI